MPTAWCLWRDQMAVETRHIKLYLDDENVEETQKAEIIRRASRREENGWVSGGHLSEIFGDDDLKEAFLDAGSSNSRYRV